MIVSHERRTLFVHVQKTGGTTVSHLLKEHLPGAHKVVGLPGAKHARLRAALRRHPELTEYWTFGFVRNPWARMWSWYSMIQRRGEQSESNEWVRTRVQRNDFWSAVVSGEMDFEAFVLQGPERFARLRTPQIRYLRTPDREADFIGRLETFHEDLTEVCQHLGLDPALLGEARNSGASGAYAEHYTPATRERVGEIFRADVRRFGYRFDSLG